MLYDHGTPTKGSSLINRQNALIHSSAVSLIQSILSSICVFDDFQVNYAYENTDRFPATKLLLDLETLETR